MITVKEIKTGYQLSTTYKDAFGQITHTHKINLSKKDFNWLSTNYNLNKLTTKNLDVINSVLIGFKA